MGRVRDLITRSLLGSWGLTANDVLEAEFDLTTRNVGGSHSESLENRHENRKHTKHLTIIPTYDSRNDPHLANFYRSKRARSGTRRKAVGRKKRDGVRLLAQACGLEPDEAGGGGDGDDNSATGSNNPNPHIDAGRSQVCPESYIVSTEQVLELKRMFYRNCREMPSDEYGTSDAAVVGRGVRKVDNTQVLLLYQRGVEITNHHRKLHNRTEIRPIALKRLLLVLGSLTTASGLDWCTFLLLTTVNLASGKDLKSLLILKDAHDRYLQQHVVDSEEDFYKMLLHLNGGVFINGSSDQMTSFFQNGDFYAARGCFTSFAEAVFSMYEHITQLYIARARGRGPRLHLNFCGHSTPGNVGGPPRPHFAKLRPMEQNPDGRWSTINTYWVP